MVRSPLRLRRGLPLAAATAALLAPAAGALAMPTVSTAGSAPMSPATSTPHPGPDTMAPAGVGQDWLPSDPWVMEHWLPYVETDMLHRLHTTRPQVQQVLTRAPLSTLAHQRHLRVSKLVAALLRPWRGRVSRAQLAVLRTRATMTFTQRHLMQHMLFHAFHEPALQSHLPEIIGSGYTDMAKGERSGMSLGDMAVANGKSLATVRSQVVALLKANVAEGQRLHAMLPAEGREWLAFEMASLPLMLGPRGGAMAGMALYCPLGPGGTTRTAARGTS